jgi:uncharacterized membrane protein
LTKPGRRVELFFLVVGLVAGAAFAVLFPPFSIADEPSHFLRAFHVSSGRLVPERTAAGMGAVLPASLPRLADELAGGLPFNHQLKVDPRIVLAALRRPLGEERQFVDFRNAAFASALPYVPQAAGIALGRSLGAPPLVLFYLARLFNLLVSTVIIWWALRRLPGRRWLIAIIALTPMATSLRGSVSADAFTIAVAFLLTAVVASHAWGPARLLDGRDYALLVGCSAALCLTKLPYCPLVLLTLLVPGERFRPGERGRRLLWLFAVTLGAVAISLWSAYHMDLPQRPGADRMLQVRDALAEPARFARLLLDDAIEHSLRYLAQLIGVLLGWLDARVPWWVIYTYLVTLALLTVTDVDPEHVPSPRRRLLLAVVVMTTLVSIAASQYAAWTPYRAPFIEGIQGRYFLPVAPAAALLFQSRRGAGRLALDRLAVWLAAVSVIGLAAALAAVAGRYY